MKAGHGLHSWQSQTQLPLESWRLKWNKCHKDYYCKSGQFTWQIGLLVKYHEKWHNKFKQTCCKIVWNIYKGGSSSSQLWIVALPYISFVSWSWSVLRTKAHTFALSRLNVVFFKINFQGINYMDKTKLIFFSGPMIRNIILA